METQQAKVLSIHKIDSNKEDSKLFNELKSLEVEIETIQKEVERTRVKGDLRIGHNLLEISRRDIWRSEVGKYKSFADYAEKRFGYTKETSRNYLRIAETFTKEEASGLSITQLWQLSKVTDEEDRAELVKEVKEGKLETTRELAAKVKTKRAEAGINVERAGHVDRVNLTLRLEPGVVAEGEFLEVRGGGTMIGQFEIGGYLFQVRFPKGRKAFEIVFKAPKDEDE